MKAENDAFEKEVLRMMAAYRERHRNDPVSDQKLRADIEKFLKGRKNE